MGVIKRVDKKANALLSFRSIVNIRVLGSWGMTRSVEQTNHPRIALWHIHNYVCKSLFKLEAQGPCAGHRSTIAILHCFSLVHEKYTN